MSTRVVAVARPRLPFPGLLWAALGRIRLFLVAIRGEHAHGPVSRGAASELDGSPTRTDPGPPTPWLVWLRDGTHRCVACGRCVALCPSRALAVERDEHETGFRALRRYALDPGRCIGCGLCAAGCPEDALVLAAGGTRVGSGGSPAPRSIVDLLRSVPEDEPAAPGPLDGVDAPETGSAA